MPATVIRQDCTHILYDPAVLEHIDGKRWFEFAASGQSSAHSGGRVPVCFFEVLGQEFALKRYARGGLAAHFSRHNYLYFGEWAVRSFMEWRLLYKLSCQGLPVPHPVAARYQRTGWLYTAELTTLSCRPAIPVSVLLTQRCLTEEEWQRIGSTIKLFHRAGVYHVDLNAHNILLDAERCFLVDFDRAAQYKMAYYWQIRMLNRLHQSLRKLKRSVHGFHFNTRNWKSLMRGYIR